MNSTREELLFALALTQPVSERAAWLDRECGDDKELRARLETLSAAHDQPETLLATQTEAARPTIKLDLAVAADRKPAPARSAEAAKFHETLSFITRECLKSSPETATSLAIPIGEAGGKYSDRLGDYSEAEAIRFTAAMKDWLARLDTVDAALKLEPDGYQPKLAAYVVAIKRRQDLDSAQLALPFLEKLQELPPDAFTNEQRIEVSLAMGIGAVLVDEPAHQALAMLTGK